MVSFFDRAKTNFAKFKSDTCSDLISALNRFRSSTFATATTTAFRQINSVGLDELQAAYQRMEAQLLKRVAELGAERAKHEKQMSPFLANPANRGLLENLKAREAARCEEHTQAITDFEKPFHSFMADFESRHVAKVRDYGDAFLQLLDLTPLPPHLLGAPETLQNRPPLDTLIQKTKKAKLSI